MTSMTKHLDQFGICQCGRRSSTDSIRVEDVDSWGRRTMDTVPVCGDCFGVL